MLLGRRSRGKKKGRGRRKKNNKWIQEAIKRPGRVKRYLKRKYGEKAFTKDGKIKLKYLNKAIHEKCEIDKDRSLCSALRLAKRFVTGEIGRK